MGFNAYQFKNNFRALDNWVATLNQQVRDTAIAGGKVQRGTFGGGTTDSALYKSTLLRRTPEGSLNYSTHVDPSQGRIASSDKIEHLAPNGLGYMLFTDSWDQPEQRVFLSRNGELHWDEDGFLRNYAGMYVADRTVIADSTTSVGVIPELDDGTNVWESMDRLRVTHGDPFGLAVGSRVQMRINLQDYIDRGLMQPDADDLRITYWDGTSHQVIPIMLDTSLGMANATVTFTTPVAIPAGAFNDNFYLHYNAPGAGPGPMVTFPTANFSDDFDTGSWPRANWSANIGDAGANWQVVNGGMEAANDADKELVQSTNTGSETKVVVTAPAATAWDDYRFQGKFGNSDSDNDSIFIYFRYQDDDNYYRLVQHTGGMAGQSRRFERRIGGVTTTLTGDSYLPPGADIGSTSSSGPWESTFDIEVRGAAIRLFQNGELVFDAIDPTPVVSGTVGLGNVSQSSWFDDISVTPLEPASATPITRNGAILEAHYSTSGLSWETWVDEYFDLARPNYERGMTHAEYGMTYFDYAKSDPQGWVMGHPGQDGLAKLVSGALESSNAYLPQVTSELNFADKVYENLTKVMMAQISNLDLLLNLVR